MFEKLFLFQWPLFVLKEKKKNDYQTLHTRDTSRYLLELGVFIRTGFSLEPQ